jgi:glycerophosphoryl diester phosphodiesterase
MTRLIHTLPLVALLATCHKDTSVWNITNLNDNKVSIFGHGGLGLGNLTPMDSYESIQKALKMGADGSEMDVQMTQDSVLVLYHAVYLEDATKAKGFIYAHNWEEISNTNYKTFTPTRYKLRDIGSVFDMLSDKNGKTFTFDCKLNDIIDPNYQQHFANALIKHIKDNDIMERSHVESTDTTFLRLLYNKEKRLKLFLYVGDFKTAAENAANLPLYGFTFNFHSITAEQIKKAHQMNLRVALFDLKSKSDNLKAIQMSPDYIQTDRLEHALKIFGKYKE